MRSGPGVTVSIAALPALEAPFVGRGAELGRLEEAQQDAGTRVVSIVGLAGIGKTQLVRQWLERLRVADHRDTRRVFGWGFDRPGKAESADRFIRDALHWIGDHTPGVDPIRARAQRLVDLIRVSPTLLVLDGLDVYQQRDGPRTGHLQHEGLALIVRELATYNPGLCVITSRMPLTEIASRRDTSAPEFALERLPRASGVRLLRELAVHGVEEALYLIVSELAGHPGALRGTANALLQHCDGDAGRRHDLPDSTPAGSEALMQGYERWFSGGVELSLLRLASFFPGPAKREALEALLREPGLERLTQELQSALASHTKRRTGSATHQSVLHTRPWKRAAARLREARLLAPRSRIGADMLAAHPLASLHFQSRMRQEFPDAWAAVRRAARQLAERG